METRRCEVRRAKLVLGCDGDLQLVPPPVGSFHTHLAEEATRLRGNDFISVPHSRKGEDNRERAAGRQRLTAS